MASPRTNSHLQAARRTSSLLYRFRTNDSLTENTPEPTKLGLHEISNSISCPIATVIFVHGLGGHPMKTWRHSTVPNTFWPQDWLPHEPGLEAVRICVFGYAADFVTTKDSTSTISDFSKRLNFDLVIKEMADAPIFFVAHSLGGLVVKKAYMMAKQDKSYNSVADRIKAMVFIGTPHRGSDAASTLHTLLSATIGSKGFVEELKTKSNALAAINEEFRHCSDELGLWSLYETLPTSIAPGRNIKIVDRESALLGYANEKNIELPGDHRTMIKFKSREDDGYNVLKTLIQHILKTYIAQQKPPEYASVEQAPQQRRRGSHATKHIAAILGQEDTNGENLLFFRDNRMLSQSCAWVYEKDVFKWWYSGKPGLSGRYLWLNGPPATGKSVMMSAVIDRAESEGKTCAFYFFRGNNTMQRTTRSFLLSLIAQMASQVPEFYNRLADIDADHTTVQAMSTRVLWQRVFVDALFEIQSDSSVSWYWFIDALDEAENPSEIVSLIGKMKSRTEIHVLTTSRPGMDIQRALQTFMPKGSLKQEQIEAFDTKADMVSYATHRLRLASLPFESEDIEHIVSIVVQKSQGIFLWLECALDSVLSTVYTIDAVPEALEGIPSDMTDFLESILEKMSQNVATNKKIAKAILQNIVCARRPLTEQELKATLTPTFGRIASLEYTVKQVCPHLVRIDKISKDESHFQLIHETVREFLLNCPHSEFGIDPLQGHHRLAQVCLSVWSDDAFLAPISSSINQPRTSEDMSEIHPLLKYSATSWFDHVPNAVIDKALEASVRDFLRTSVLSWVEAVGLLNDVSLLTSGALALETCVIQSPLISLSDKKLISGWAVDLVRIGPKYGRNITAYPFSIHKLLPPFCPTKTRIGSQFGGAADITIVGTGLKNWDDCLAHMVVGRDGELCKHLVCGHALLAVGLSCIDGTVALYDIETCQEIRRLQHGERLGALDMDPTGERIVTGGVTSIKVWNTRSGEIVHELKTTGNSRCMAVTFRAGGKSVASFTSDDILITWDLRRDSTQFLQWNRPTTGDRYRGSACSVVFSKDGTKISLAYKGWPIEIWDLEKMGLIGTVSTRSPVASCYNPCNDDVYTIDHDGSVIHLDMETQTTTKTAADARVLACNSAGTLIATGNADGVLKIFAADTMELLYKLDKYTECINSLCFSPDGTKLYDVRSSECNVWVPEVLLVSVREDSSVSGTESENSSFGRIPQSVVLESGRSLVNVTALASDSTGSFICCGKSNGAVFLHDTQSGRQLQFLYNHATTVNIQTLAWSADGTIIASGDNGGRIIVAMVQLVSSSKWSCVVKLDFQLDQHLDGGVRQLLLSPNSMSLLVSSQGSYRMFTLEDGKDIGERKVYDGNYTPWWLVDPLRPQHIILFEPEKVHRYSWESFSRISSDNGIKLRSSHVSSGWHDGFVQMKAYATQDGQRIVSEWSTNQSGRPVKVSYWNTADFDRADGVIEEACNWNRIFINRVVGMYRNHCVFFDRDLWLCSSGCATDHETTRHFYMPMDWLNSSESRLSLMTRSGEFVYAKHGDVIIVKRGMRSNQGIL